MMPGNTMSKKDRKFAHTLELRYETGSPPAHIHLKIPFEFPQTSFIFRTALDQHNILQDLIKEFCTALPPDVKNKDAFFNFNKTLKDSLEAIIVNVMKLFGLNEKEDDVPQKKLKDYFERLRKDYFESLRLSQQNSSQKQLDFCWQDWNALIDLVPALSRAKLYHDVSKKLLRIPSVHESKKYVENIEKAFGDVSVCVEKEWMKLLMYDYDEEFPHLARTQQSSPSSHSPFNSRGGGGAIHAHASSE